MTTAASRDRPAVLRAALDLDRSNLVGAGATVALLAIALFLIPQLLGSDWILNLTSVSIYSVAALGFSILYGRVGLISLGQIALLTIGIWVGARLAYATSLPFPVLLLISGGVTCVIGVLVGLPALRLSGLYLALITLMFAGATQIVISVINFPDGGGGFKGRFATGELATETPPVRRPSWAHSDVAYYRYVVVVAAILFLLALVHVAAKPGRAWAAIRESEPAALSAGVNITLYKLWAFALASFMTGVAGCLLAAESSVPQVISFQTQDSLTLAATAMIGGIFSIWGAIVAGAFNQLLSFLFQTEWGIDPLFLLVVFGAGLLQVLLAAPGGLVEQFPKDMANLGRLIARRVPVTRQAVFGIGSILALIAGIALLATVTPIVGFLAVMLSPILAVFAQD